MTDEGIEAAVRRAIGGDAAAVAWVVGQADETADATLLTMAALLATRPEWLDRAEALAGTSRQRQVVAIARAHLRGEADLVDALARDHLVDFPDNLVVAWIAATSAGPDPA
jgi:hypothetical protein